MTSSAFKLKKQIKRTMATILDPVKKNEYKRNMIQAQVSLEDAQRKPLKMKDKE
jgi:hypothetical protein